jgi:hypothetical protein
LAAILIAAAPELFVYFPVLALSGMAAGTFTGLCGSAGQVSHPYTAELALMNVKK